jgi:hypothetical protein
MIYGYGSLSDPNHDPKFTKKPASKYKISRNSETVTFIFVKKCKTLAGKTHIQTLEVLHKTRKGREIPVVKRLPVSPMLLIYIGIQIPGI